MSTHYRFPYQQMNEELKNAYEQAREEAGRKAALIHITGSVHDVTDVLPGC